MPGFSDDSILAVVESSLVPMRQAHGLRGAPSAFRHGTDPPLTCPPSCSWWDMGGTGAPCDASDVGNSTPQVPNSVGPGPRCALVVRLYVQRLPPPRYSGAPHRAAMRRVPICAMTPTRQHQHAMAPLCRGGGNLCISFGEPVRPAASGTKETRPRPRSNPKIGLVIDLRNPERTSDLPYWRLRFPQKRPHIIA